MTPSGRLALGRPDQRVTTDRRGAQPPREGKSGWAPRTIQHHTGRPAQAQGEGRKGLGARETTPATADARSISTSMRGLPASRRAIHGISATPSKRRATLPTITCRSPTTASLSLPLKPIQPARLADPGHVGRENWLMTVPAVPGRREATRPVLKRTRRDGYDPPLENSVSVMRNLAGCAWGWFSRFDDPPPRWSWLVGVLFFVFCVFWSCVGWGGWWGGVARVAAQAWQ